MKPSGKILRGTVATRLVEDDGVVVPTVNCIAVIERYSRVVNIPERFCDARAGELAKVMSWVRVVIQQKLDVEWKSK